MKMEKIMRQLWNSSNEEFDYTIDCKNGERGGEGIREEKGGVVISQRAGLHHPHMPDFKWLCRGSMSEIEKERSRVCLERPLFHSPRQTDTYSLSLHNRGGKQITIECQFTPLVFTVSHRT